MKEFLFFIVFSLVAYASAASDFSLANFAMANLPTKLDDLRHNLPPIKPPALEFGVLIRESASFNSSNLALIVQDMFHCEVTGKIEENAKSFPLRKISPNWRNQLENTAGVFSYNHQTLAFFFRKIGKKLYVFFHATIPDDAYPALKDALNEKLHHISSTIPKLKSLTAHDITKWLLVTLPGLGPTNTMLKYNEHENKKKQKDKLLIVKPLGIEITLILGCLGRTIFFDPLMNMAALAQEAKYLFKCPVDYKIIIGCDTVDLLVDLEKKMIDITDILKNADGEGWVHVALVRSGRNSGNGIDFSQF